MRGRLRDGAKFILAAVFIGSSTAPAAFADCWELPEKMNVCSANGGHCLEIVPRPVESEVRYLQDLGDGRASPGCPLDTPCPSAHAVVTTGDRKGLSFPLVNDVGPASVLVSDGGRLVTFDDWHAMGSGPNAIVIYAPDGTVIRDLALTDFLVESDAETISRSIDWRYSEGIDEERELLTVSVVVGGDIVPAFEIDLIAGTVLTPKHQYLPVAEPEVAVEAASNPADARAVRECDGQIVDTPNSIPSQALLDAAVDKPLPDYPHIAVMARVVGSVTIRLVVDPTNGTVMCAQRTAGVPILDAATLDAVRRWTFSLPAAGRAPVVAALRFKFTLPMRVVTERGCGMN